MTNNAAATDETNPTDDAVATCPYCGDDYPAERAEIGYAFCMKKDCAERGKKDKGVKPIEIEVIQPETRF